MSSDDEHDSRLSHSSSDPESSSTADGIADARLAKSTKTRKRKRRATSPSRFGSALTALLESDLPSNHQPLALKPAAAKRRTDEALENKARKLLEGERKEREEKNHIQDVIGGWGTERERSLRKVAQRGGTHVAGHTWIAIGELVSLCFQSSSCSTQSKRRKL